MASLKSAMKGHQKTHRERGQVSGRKHLGLLEKRKDYVKRAKNFHMKEDTLKTLRKKATEKNPDEFYFQMVNTKMKNGVHEKQYDEKTYTKPQIDLMKTQDINYLNLQKNQESHKIRKLEENLHFIDESDQQDRKHVFFVDTKEEEREFDPATHLSTLPSLLSQTHNRPTLDMLSKTNFAARTNTKKRNTKYRELQTRIERSENLGKSVEGLAMQRKLMGKGTVRKQRKNGNVSYKWKKIRKR